jgi:TetR/AcrR family transcriptional regulator, regulator of cefoperazone and chloramphenicol sensitivity
MTKTLPETPEKTRQRLLDVAGEVFAEHGFGKTTVRDICTRAGANVAAVNYHFGDKQGLYNEVLRLAHQCATEKYPDNAGLSASASAEYRLHAFVQSFLMRIFDTGQPAWLGKLISREIIEPTAALDVVVSEGIKPRIALLHGILRDLLGKDTSPEALRRCAFSVVGQCIFYHHARAVLDRLGHPRLDAAGIDRLADHITDLTLHGLKGMARGKRKDKRR